VVDSQPPTVGPTQEGKRNLKVRIQDVRFEYPGGDTTPYLVSGQPVTIRVRYEAVEPVHDLVCGIAVYDNKGWMLFGWNTDILGVDLGTIEGSGEIAFAIREMPLLDGTYPVTVGLHSHDEATVYDWSEQRYNFEVMSPTRAAGVIQVDVKVTVNGSSVQSRRLAV
jgi:hypothetical protein